MKTIRIDVVLEMIRKEQDEIIEESLNSMGRVCDTAKMQVGRLEVLKYQFEQEAKTPEPPQ